MASARDERLTQPWPVLSVAEAARRLPLADRDARAWLRRRGLIVELEGRRVVSWHAVHLALLEDPDPIPEPQEERQYVALPRKRLEPL